MKNTKPTMRKIQAGDEVEVTYGDGSYVFRARFLGFTDRDEQYSEKPVFDCWKDVAAATGAKSFKALELLQDQEVAEDVERHGYSVYAVFEEAGLKACAYLYDGGWCIGSSAQRIRLDHTPERRAEIEQAEAEERDRAELARKAAREEAQEIYAIVGRAVRSGDVDRVKQLKSMIMGFGPGQAHHPAC